MCALRLISPARAGVRLATTYQMPPRCTFRSSFPIASSRPAHHLQRPFSHTGRRRNNWRDPRHRDPHEELARAKPLISQEGISRFLWSPSLHAIVVLSAASAVAFYFMNIETVPVSGRRRFNCYSDDQVRAAGEAQMKHIIYDLERAGRHFLPDWHWKTKLVKRVLERLIPVSGMEDSEWEVRVIDDPRTANAFVLPGGKVFVFSGIIPIAGNEHGLAAVLGHEISHNLAEHVAERMSSQIGINILLYSLIFLTGGVALLGTSYIGYSVLNLIFSRPMDRRQESEADYIGLMMMAEACYDPREALGFWERMKKAQQEEPPEWMSTHPSNSNRIQKIQEWMPEALDKMHQSDCRGTATFANLFRRALERHIVMERRDDI
ncbi:peptidase family M48-domain-containing protein [Xylaria intraflava]|nr:peptidase family M48-domain-containing protein [Xylaria intraflava]